MNLISIEEAKTLEAFAKCRSISKTASALKKGNTAIVYALNSIEEKSGVKLFDRTGYRIQLLPAGERVLEGCIKLLASAESLDRICESLASGWESELQLIIEGLVPLDPIIRGIKRISLKECPTRFHIESEFMGAVEETFLRVGANLLISVLRPEKSVLSSVPLFKVPAYLVASKHHPLVQRNKTSGKEMKKYPILTVKGSSSRLQMDTAQFEGASRFQFNDFFSKKLALMSGLGYGWLPEYLMRYELRSGQLRLIEWERSNEHVFHPQLYHRGEARLGKTAKMFIDFLTSLKEV